MPSSNVPLNENSIISLRIIDEHRKETDLIKNVNNIPIPSIRCIENYCQMKKFDSNENVNYISYTSLESDSNGYDSKAIEYELDDEDEEWINENFVDIDEESLEIIIDYLEKESFKNMEFIHYESKFKEYDDDDDIYCCVCGIRDHSDNNLILFCDGCNLAIHQDCQGLSIIPEGEWYCDACDHYIKELINDISKDVDEIQCVLCHKPGSAFKRTNKNSFVHIICSLLAPELFYENGYVNINLLDNRRETLICSICGEKGGCVQCGIKNCYNSFHSICAQKRGLVFMFGNDDSHFEYNKNPKKRKKRKRMSRKSLPTEFKCLCVHHSAVHKFKQFEKNLTDSTIKVDVGKFINEDTYHNIRNLINKNLTIGLIDKIINYWKSKRNRFNNGKVPLIYQLNFMIEFGNKSYDVGYKLNGRKVQKYFEMKGTGNLIDFPKIDLENIRKIAKSIIDKRNTNKDDKNQTKSSVNNDTLSIMTNNYLNLSLKRNSLKLKKESCTSLSINDCTSRLINYSKKKEDIFNRSEFCK